MNVSLRNLSYLRFCFRLLYHCKKPIMGINTYCNMKQVHNIICYYGIKWYYRTCEQRDQRMNWKPKEEKWQNQNLNNRMARRECVIQEYILAFPGIKPITLVLRMPCSIVWATWIILIVLRVLIELFVFHY